MLGHTEHVKPGQWLQVDPRSDKPLFDQLRRQLIDGIRAGTLPPGTRLPTVRELAGQLGLAVNTVARTYRELETAGVVETRRRLGTFVARVDPADAAMAAAAQSFPRHSSFVGSRQGRGGALPRHHAGALTETR